MTATPAPTPTPTPIRHFTVHASSAPVFGRVLCSARNHHWVVDGPLYNNCPGEALTPPELFLAAIASCGVELMHVIAKDQNLPLQHAAIVIDGFVDRDKQPRSDVTLFNSVQLRARLRGVSRDQATIVVEGFRKRCPIFGTVSAAALETIVEYEVE